MYYFSKRLSKVVLRLIYTRFQYLDDQRFNFPLNGKPNEPIFQIFTKKTALRNNGTVLFIINNAHGIYRVSTI